MVTELTAEQAAALDIARRLAAAGIPVFLIRPDPAGKGSGGTGYWFPPGWQQTRPDPAAVDVWQPGMALGAVMGCGLDVIDLDPRNGADPAALNGTRPRYYAVAVTPSGGAHMFIASIGEHSRDNLLPGIDYKGGAPDGAGRGFAFIAPTVKRSKGTGEPAAYQWVNPPDLAALAAGGDGTGAGFAELVRAKRNGTAAHNGNGTAAGAVGFAAQLAAAPVWADIAGTLAEHGRNGGVFRLAASLRDRGGWQLADAVEYIRAVVWPLIDQEQGGHPFSMEEFEAAITSAWRYQDGDERRAAQLAAIPAAAVAPPGRGGKPRFEVNNTAIAAEQLRAALGAGPLAGLYLRDGVLVHTPRTGEDGYVMPTEDEKKRGIDHGPAQVRSAAEKHVRSLVEVVYDVGKVAAEKDRKSGAVLSAEWVPALFPPDAARHAVGAAELGIGCPRLRHLAGVTHTPVLRPDGTVLAEPGHDAGTGLLYLPDRGLAVPPVPEHPDASQVAAAVALLRHPVALFPWVKPYHEANWLGAMFTPLLRLLLPPPYPMLIITATNAGSGKTLLMRLLGIVHGIATRGEFPREREELRKLIVSTLHTTTAPVIGLDNVRGTIYSSELEALLTARTLTDRELGASRNITVTNDRLWVATGNNARIGGDLARRCLPVALDPKCADPHRRRFAFSPADWMTANRGAYIAALLTVARGWVLAGAPAGDPGSSDDYGPWRGALRGLLGFAGVPGTFGDGSTGDLAGVSEDDDAWGAFVAELDRVFGEQSFTTADIIAHLDRPLSPGPAAARPRSGREEFTDDTPHVAPGDHLGADCLPGELAEKWARVGYGKTSGFGQSLGGWLNYRDGRFTADGLAVRQVAQRKGNRPARFRIDGQE